ncbi:unnamed protein product [Acanthoscelides obtectus]|uniref:Uncharacterized protein n=1 Tax=Acanthoscelides obtectus TaxID=200917 RepID=A0A9P0MCN5_ACAOB|nr:unnamed protein product [Acanthoscelides obtectus]CAK1631201.1 hypothetical protein AOBTE_LOCUS6810 [Acanthoscelides obtectus]
MLSQDIALCNAAADSRASASGSGAGGGGGSGGGATAVNGPGVAMAVAAGVGGGAAGLGGGVRHTGNDDCDNKVATLMDDTGLGIGQMLVFSAAEVSDWRVWSTPRHVQLEFVTIILPYLTDLLVVGCPETPPALAETVVEGVTPGTGAGLRGCGGMLSSVGGVTPVQSAIGGATVVNTPFPTGNCEIDFCDTLVDFSHFLDEYDQSNDTVLDLNPEILSDSDIEMMDSSVEWNPSNGYVTGLLAPRYTRMEPDYPATTRDARNTLPDVFTTLQISDAGSLHPPTRLAVYQLLQQLLVGRRGANT